MTGSRIIEGTQSINSTSDWERLRPQRLSSMTNLNLLVRWVRRLVRLLALEKQLELVGSAAVPLLMNYRQSIKGRCSDVEKCTYYSRHMSGCRNYEVNRPRRKFKLLQHAHQASGSKIVRDVIGECPCDTSSSLRGTESTFNVTDHEPRREADDLLSAGGSKAPLGSRRPMAHVHDVMLEQFPRRARSSSSCNVVRACCQQAVDLPHPARDRCLTR